MLLRARIVLPISRPPIADGAVLISGKSRRGPGPWRDLSARRREPATDLGAVILLPGLVNAHCHLDYTDMAGLPPPETIPRLDQGPARLQSRRQLRRLCPGLAARRRHAPPHRHHHRGGHRSRARNCCPEVWSSTPLRVISFLEMTGVQKPPQAGGNPAGSRGQNRKPLTAARFCRPFAPRALFDDAPRCSRQTAELARQRRWRVTMHVAESD